MEYSSSIGSRARYATRDELCVLFIAILLLSTVQQHYEGYFCDVLKGLQYLHFQRVVHRGAILSLYGLVVVYMHMRCFTTFRTFVFSLLDIKPSNLLISSSLPASSAISASSSASASASSSPPDLGVAKIGDFGVSVVLASQAELLTTVAGTVSASCDHKLKQSLNLLYSCISFI